MPIYPLTTFNLSILECKCVWNWTAGRQRNTFNLSILECKFLCAAYPQTILPPFNLSILECKFASSRTTRSAVTLLISPYWNVNAVYINSIDRIIELLISPYWNVNYVRGCTKRTDSKAFNLSILECKLNRCFSSIDQSRTFNLSILECKCKHLHGRWPGNQPF